MRNRPDSEPIDVVDLTIHAIGRIGEGRIYPFRAEFNPLQNPNSASGNNLLLSGLAFRVSGNHRNDQAAAESCNEIGDIVGAVPHMLTDTIANSRSQLPRKQLTIGRANLYEGSGRQIGALHMPRRCQETPARHLPFDKSRFARESVAFRCRLRGTSADISAQPCDLDLRLQAASLVTFPHSDWTMSPQMISLLIALKQIVVKIDFRSAVGRFAGQSAAVVVAVLKGATVKRGSNPKSSTIGAREYAGAKTCV